MTSQLGVRGRDRQCKVPVTPLELPSILICLGIMSMPIVRSVPHRLALLQFYCISIIFSKKKCFSNALGYTLGVLEVL